MRRAMAWPTAWIYEESPPRLLLDVWCWLDLTCASTSPSHSDMQQCSIAQARATLLVTFAIFGYITVA